MKKKISNANLLRVLTGALIFFFFLALISGRYPEVGFLDFQTFKNDPTARRIFLQLRLPRVILGVLLGMSLGAAGMTFQIVFKNPLVDSGMMGVTQGAAFGASIAIVLCNNNPWTKQFFALGFGCAGLALALIVAREIHYGGWILRLILSGSVVSSLFSAGISILKFIADGKNQLHAIEFWLMGGIGFTVWRGLPLVIVLVAGATLGLWLMRWRLNLLSLSDSTALSLSVDVTKERLLFLGLSVIAVSAVSSLSGIVGWVGLITPHLARLLFGVDTRDSLPGSMLLGGLITLLCDSGLRIFFQREIPLGIITSLMGVLIFVLLTRKGREGRA